MSQDYIKDLVNEVEKILHKKLNNGHKMAMLHSTPSSHAKNNITALQLFVLNKVQGQYTGKNRNQLLAELKNLMNKPQARATLNRKMMKNLVNKQLLASDIMPGQWHEVLEDVQKKIQAKTQAKTASLAQTQTTTQPGKPNKRRKAINRPGRPVPQAQPLSLPEITDVFDQFKARKKAEAEKAEADKKAAEQAAARQKAEEERQKAAEASQERTVRRTQDVPVSAPSTTLGSASASAPRSGEGSVPSESAEEPDTLQIPTESDGMSPLLDLHDQAMKQPPESISYKAQKILANNVAELMIVFLKLEGHEGIDPTMMYKAMEALVPKLVSEDLINKLNSESMELSLVFDATCLQKMVKDALKHQLGTVNEHQSVDEEARQQLEDQLRQLENYEEISDQDKMVKAMLHSMQSALKQVEPAGGGKPEELVLGPIANERPVLESLSNSDNNSVDGDQQSQFSDKDQSPISASASESEVEKKEKRTKKEERQKRDKEKKERKLEQEAAEKARKAEEEVKKNEINRMRMEFEMLEHLRKMKIENSERLRNILVGALQQKPYAQLNQVEVMEAILKAKDNGKGLDGGTIYEVIKEIFDHDKKTWENMGGENRVRNWTLMPIDDLKNALNTRIEKIKKKKKEKGSNKEEGEGEGV